MMKAKYSGLLLIEKHECDKIFVKKLFKKPNFDKNESKTIQVMVGRSNCQKTG